MNRRFLYITPPRPHHTPMPPQPNLAEEAAMQHSTARRIHPAHAATTRQATKASTPPRRPASHRTSHATIAELREELGRIQRDIQELTSDFEARIKPLSKAFEKAHKKLLELDPPPKRKKGREPRSRYTEPRG